MKNPPQRIKRHNHMSPSPLPQLHISTSFGLGVIIRHHFVRWTVFREGYTFNWGNEVTGGSLQALLQLLHRVPTGLSRKHLNMSVIILQRYHSDLTKRDPSYSTNNARFNLFLQYP